MGRREDSKEGNVDIYDHILLYTNMESSKKPGIVTYVYNPNDEA